MISAVTAAITSLIVYFAQSYIKRKRLTNKLRVVVEYYAGNDNGGGRPSCRVCNDGQWTIHNATPYITLQIKKGDIIKPPDGNLAFMMPDTELIEDQQLCWSVRPNPLKVDIYAGEKQHISLCGITENHIMLPSEEGWVSSITNSSERKHVRAYLERKKYDGQIKIVSDDTNAKSFKFTIDPDNKTCPLSLTPA